MKMSQKMPMDGFEWRNDKFRFNEEFMQGYDEDSDKGYILQVKVFQGATRVIQRSITLSEKKIMSVRNSYVIYITQKLCNTHKSSEADIA